MGCKTSWLGATIVTILKNVYLTLFLVILGTSALSAEETKSASSKSILVVGGSNPEGLTPFPNDEDTQKMFKRKKLEDEATEFIKKGMYDQALVKIKSAMDSNLQVSGYNSSIPNFLLREVYVLQGKYDEALVDINKMLAGNPNQQTWIDEKLQIESLIKARSANSPEPIYECIQSLRDKYNDSLPPKSYNSFSSIVTNSIVHLYDHIGDLDGGIAFIDQILVYPKLSKRARNEYSKIKQAFEEDKNHGTKGRATKALIQSDYFPW